MSGAVTQTCVSLARTAPLPAVGPYRATTALLTGSRKHNSDGVPVHSFRTLLKDLATLVKNRIRFGESRFGRFTTPTPLQQRAFDLLGVQP